MLHCIILYYALLQYTILYSIIVWYTNPDWEAGASLHKKREIQYLEWQCRASLVRAAIRRCFVSSRLKIVVFICHVIWLTVRLKYVTVCWIKCTPPLQILLVSKTLGNLVEHWKNRQISIHTNPGPSGDPYHIYIYIYYSVFSASPCRQSIEEVIHFMLLHCSLAPELSQLFSNVLMGLESTLTWQCDA